MARTKRFGWQGVMAVVVFIAAGRVSAHGQASAARVRAEDPALSALIRQAIDQSATFRSLVEAIQATNGIVYVIRGRCGHYVKACLLLWMGAAGSRAQTCARGPHRVECDDRGWNVQPLPAQRRREGRIRDEAAIAAGHAVYNELKRRRAN